MVFSLYLFKLSYKMIATRMQAVKPSPTLYLTQKAAELKSAGHDIISLSAGEPDFSTPAWVCQAAKEAIDQGQTRYTPVGGTVQLKKAIMEKFKRDQQLSYTPREVMAAAGGKQVIFNALLATLNPGDEVIIPAPYWVSYLDIVLLAEGTPLIISCDQSADFKLTPQRLEESITPRTKWLLLNSPSNPTGMVYTYQELEALGHVLKKHPHVWVLCDDIYEPIVYDQSFFTLAQAAPYLKERILIVNGLSKSYSMTGWRLGYGAGPSSLIDAMTILQSQSTSNPCSITQAAGVAALEGSQTFIRKNTDIFKTRRDLAISILRESPFLNITTPQGAFYLYPHCEKAIGHHTPSGMLLKNDGDVASYLLDQVGVAVIPGEAFGCSPYIRLSYALDSDTLAVACNRILKALSQLVP